MPNAISFQAQFDQLVLTIKRLISTDPARAYRIARTLLRQAAALPFGNDPVANVQRFNMIDEARQLVTAAKLALVAAGGMVPADPDPDDDAPVTPIRPKP
jgi:hypothetical protein